MKKTLVIHPKDQSTTFLNEIYSEQPEWTVYNSPMWVLPVYAQNSNFFNMRDIENQLNPNTEDLNKLIEEHDRIIMMGHGSTGGLFGRGPGGFLISDSHAELLRTKELVGIWCNADRYFIRNRLKGFYTGMMASEVGEARYCAIPADYQEVVESNALFSQAAKQAVFTPDPVSIMKEVYVHDTNLVIDYNRHNLHYKPLILETKKDDKDKG